MWGIARFGDAESRARVDALGVTTRVCDVADGDFTDVPDDFTYVVHLAAFQGPGEDFDHAIRVNAEGTGLLLAHCRRAKAALVMSTHSVYRPNDDPLHVYRETDPLGEVNSALSPPYSMSKIAQEAVARACARSVRPARRHRPHERVLRPQRRVTRLSPRRRGRRGARDDAAGTRAPTARSTRTTSTSRPPLLLDAGDRARPHRELGRGRRGERAGVVCRTSPSSPGTRCRSTSCRPPGTLRGSIADPTARAAITGPCKVGWQRRAAGRVRVPPRGALHDDVRS